MNAYEIIKNIIPDGIKQAQKSIWERLLLPDFNEEEPKIIYSQFKTPEEFLEFELKYLAAEDKYFEKEFIASHPMMNEEEYFNANFSHHYKAYAPDYFEYRRKWKIDHEKITNIERSRKEIKNLIENDILSIRQFKLLKLSDMTLQRFDTYKIETYSNYCKMWEKSQTEEGKQNVLKECEQWWFLNFHSCFYWKNLMDLRILENEIKSNYTIKWENLKKKEKNDLKNWENHKRNYLSEKQDRDDFVDELKIGYLQKRPNSIVNLSKEILKHSNYNFEFEKDFEIVFNPENKILIIDYTLPNIEQLPRIKETKYLTSKKEFKNFEIAQRELQKLFDETCYSIALRSIYEVLIDDTNKVIDAVNFNGWIKSVNKSTGKKENICILSILVKQSVFMDIELQNIEPKSCFKFFKGVGSSKLYGITAVQPILQVQKEDKRFVDSQNIEFNDLTNLALMDWEDFEHLIRELFEKEFISNGGEVKVTQVSRDGGVDAIAFDPIQFEVEKIVIQAKRYTNTVGVSAVRDLYGTVLNEGANKGILVTTSDYGTDSYKFAKGKPLTLLNGANLLYLLERHGTIAKIDIKEAKRIQRENK